MFRLCRRLTFVLIACVQLQVVQNEKIVKLLAITCECVQPTSLNITVCTLKQMPHDMAEVSVAVTLLQRPINNASLSALLIKRGYEDRAPIVDYTIDGCAFFRNKRRNFLAAFAHKAMGLDKYSNLNHSCPYDHDILVDRYAFNGRAIGKIIPFGNGEFTFVTKWLTYNDLKAIVKIRFIVFDR
ncbi:uncharacterized protein LOC105224665 [Bactrocera dorsalis]|uniref:Uncharacterized protein LOC105224665 n=1 Tax=Bactrocera dorsalis TaxID=27457 RepID=A0ABM3JGN2_BACDO|nr:uncharacterized protein LOC105224665 [Bactrocera dorsalis]